MLQYCKLVAIGILILLPLETARAGIIERTGQYKVEDNKCYEGVFIEKKFEWQEFDCILALRSRDRYSHALHYFFLINELYMQGMVTEGAASHFNKNFAKHLYNALRSQLESKSYDESLQHLKELFSESQRLYLPENSEN